MTTAVMRPRASARRGEPEQMRVKRNSRKIAVDGNVPKAIASRRGDILRVRCPHCGYLNEFPGFVEVYVFPCHDCEEPVAVTERVQ